MKWFTTKHILQLNGRIYAIEKARTFSHLRRPLYKDIINQTYVIGIRRAQIESPTGRTKTETYKKGMWLEILRRDTKKEEADIAFQLGFNILGGCLVELRESTLALSGMLAVTSKRIIVPKKDPFDYGEI